MNLGDFVQSKISQGDAYEVIGTLGSGGFGTVWRVNRLSDNKEFAMKVPKSDPVMIKALKKEYEVLRRLAELNVPNVVHAVELCDHIDSVGNKLPVLIMTKAEGSNIDSWMLKGAISEDDCLEIAKKMCETVAALHEAGYIHRDIKPENVMLADLGGRNQVTFIDLGIAALKADKDTHVMVSLLAHSHHWSPPEQRANSAQVSIGNDIFSVGATIFAMLLGSASSSIYWSNFSEDQLPHDIHTQNPAIDKQIRYVIYRSTCYDRSGRFPTMKEMLLSLSGGLPDESYPRIIADGKVHPLRGPGPWIIGRKCDLSGTADIQVMETSNSGCYISREQALVTRLGDGIFELSRHTNSKNDVWIKPSSRWEPVNASGFKFGARYEEMSLGYSTNPPKDVKPGPYKEIEFFPPKVDSTKIM